ncbi:MAG: multidrug effflux MFS transporter [Burkholderiaceae bacterium]
MTAPAAVAGTPSPQNTKRRLTIILGMLTGFAPFSIDMYLAAFPAIANTLGSGVEQVQHSLAAFFVGIAAGQILYGPAIDRFGRRGPMLLGITIYVLTSITLIWAPNIESFIAVRFVQALGACGGMVVARAMIRDLYDVREAAIALSMMMAVVSLGPVVAPLLGSLVLSWSRWQAIFAFLGVYGVICFLLATRYLPETLPAEKRSHNNPWQVLGTFSALLKRPPFMVPALTGGFAFAGVFAYITAAPFLLMSLYGLDERSFAWVFALIACFLIIATQINQRLLRRLMPHRILKIGVALNLLASIGLMAIHQTDSLPIMAVVLALWTCTLPLIGSNGTAVAMSQSGRYAGSASSIIGVTQFSLAGAVSFLVGFFHDGTAFPMAAVMMACSVIAATVLIIGRTQTTASIEAQTNGAHHD